MFGQDLGLKGLVDKLRKGTRIFILDKPYVVKDLIVYIDDEDKRWYEYKLVPEGGLEVIYLSVDPNSGELEVARSLDLDFTGDMDLEKALNYKGRTFYYEDDYEAKCYSPWDGEDEYDAEELEIYEYYNPQDEEYLTLEVYYDDDDEVEDIEGSISKPIDIKYVRLG